jgi:hypothetical protein
MEVFMAVKKNEAQPDDLVRSNNQDNKIVNVKKRRVWPWVVAVFALIGVLVLIPLLVLGFMGFVPGLSNIIGANKPRDLGVKWTAADYASYQQKTGGQFLDFANAPVNPNNPSKKTVFANPKQMEVSLTQEEITAAINSTNWLWMPIKNAQVKFNDGGLELSGSVNAAYIPQFVNFIGGVGYPQSAVDQASNWAKLFGNPPIYLKANASVEDNKVALTITEAKVSRFSVPVDIANKVILSGSNNAIPRTNGLDIKSTTFSNGQMQFNGTTPTTVYVKRN